MSNISTLPIPGCASLLIEVGILDKIPYFDVVTDTTTISELIDGNVETYNDSKIFVKEYTSGKEYTRSKQFSKTITDSLGFNAVIPEKQFKLPGLVINKFPFFKKGCNDKVDSDWPLICGEPSVRKVSACRRILGRRICISTYVPDFDKRLNEIYLDELKIPELRLFSLEKTVLKLKYKL
jgi:hypothetical protein